MNLEREKAFWRFSLWLKESKIPLEMNLLDGLLLGFHFLMVVIISKKIASLQFLFVFFWNSCWPYFSRVCSLMSSLHFLCIQKNGGYFGLISKLVWQTISRCGELRFSWISLYSGFVLYLNLLNTFLLFTSILFLI